MEDLREEEVFVLGLSILEQDRDDTYIEKMDDS